MDVKLKSSEYHYTKCCCREKILREESRDAVVPDTMQDISAVLCPWGRVLIRSKDVAEGRITVEANVSVCVLCTGEDGSLCHLELSLPFFFSAENEAIGENCFATARLELKTLEARALNPRKLGVRAELCAELCAYGPAEMVWASDIEGESHIHCRRGQERLSFISRVTEKSFTLADELSLPPAAKTASEPICLTTECMVDELKNVGSKMIVRGRLRSMLLLEADEGVCHLEPVTEFSQIIELGEEKCEGLAELWLTPSGSYCSLLRENEGRISLEYHLVAQLLCRRNEDIDYLRSAYSNSFGLREQRQELEGEYIRESGKSRESCRQLFETARAVREVISSSCSVWEPVFEDGKIRLPFSFTALCSDGEGLWCEKRRSSLSLRLPECEGEPLPLKTELMSFSVIPVAGGLELRLEAELCLGCRAGRRIEALSALSYDELCPQNTAALPSIVLLRISGEEDIWDIARENCSEPGAILRANGIDSLTQGAGELLLVPKIC